jgi:hypothetical protein
VWNREGAGRVKTNAAGIATDLVPPPTYNYEGTSMLRITRTIASSLALFVVAGAIATPAAIAWSTDGAYHEASYTAQKKGASVTFQIFNKADDVQQVKVAEQVYKLDPHSAVKITAPAGAQVIAASDSKSHHNGDVLFEVSTALKGNTASID